MVDHVRVSPARHAHLSLPDPELPALDVLAGHAARRYHRRCVSPAGHERFSRTGRVRDVAAIKAARAERARAQRAELEAAWSLLDTGGPVRLAAFGRWTMHCSSGCSSCWAGLAASPDSSGTRRATADGRIETCSPPADGATATLIMPRRTFRGPDYENRRSGACGPPGAAGRLASGRERARWLT